ncbi:MULTISPECIES: response regulator receiver domain [unclassified Pseudomonas]|uniref:response regulator receiver domain n=1 Tax=unclassified Pseudomonas TaxID=196821 RepID=UPI001C447E13|nr:MULTISPECIES: response regulator receiver domain [unclassified Pseudomonas]MCU1737003.1 response regulator receiver domain [Pseudomonas sp. 20S_6.2_Bac1]
MGTQEAEVLAVVQDPTAIWSDHIQRAVGKFLKTAVVIDNQPYIKESYRAVVNGESLRSDSGLGGDLGALVEPSEQAPQAGVHDLDLRKVSDVFAERGVACAFVLPDDAVNDDDAKKKRALCAARASDIVVIDWYLKRQDASLTLQILKEVAESDCQENGRMRLICVYTGEPLDNAIFEDIKEHLAQGGLNLQNVDDVEFCAVKDGTLVVLLNKETVPAEHLPGELICLFSRLADGLIPAFALAAVGAIRKNTHHMLTRFGKALDSAYIANRLITNPPGDVAELMRELLVAECDNALGLDRIADDYLEHESISKWLDKNQHEFVSKSYDIKVGGVKKDVSMGRETINGLLRYGLSDRGITLDGDSRIGFPEFHRGKISEVLAGGLTKARRAENEFSRLVSFRREAFGLSTSLISPHWKPSLTTGTVLRYQEGDKFRYLMCFTPACDALRLEAPRPFVFLEGIESSKPYNMVMKVEGGRSVGLHFDKKYPIVRTFLFSPDRETQRVRGERTDAEGQPSCFVFKSLENHVIEFTWLGEIRYGRASSEMAALANVWMRIGVIDSEYLRLAGREHFPFED